MLLYGTILPSTALDMAMSSAIVHLMNSKASSFALEFLFIPMDHPPNSDTPPGTGANPVFPITVDVFGALSMVTWPEYWTIIAELPSQKAFAPSSHHRSCDSGVAYSTHSIEFPSAALHPLL